MLHEAKSDDQAQRERSQPGEEFGSVLKIKNKIEQRRFACRRLLLTAHLCSTPSN
jgi:hypothetical protein